MDALRIAAAALVIAAAAIAGCSSAAAPIDVRPGDACANCRMAVSQPKLAAQIAAPGEEPRFYDDIGCLAKAIVAAGGKADDAFVADHRTGAWVRADRAVYTHAPNLETPMGSHIIAHADDDSRRADPAAAGGRRMSFAEVVETVAGQHHGH